MKPELQQTEPRSQVIFRYHQRVLFETGTCERTLSARIADQYMACVPEAHRIVEFHAGTTADSAEKAIKANAQIIRRFVDRKVKLPVDLEEAWVRSFPEPLRMECKRELARRYGFLAAKAPEIGAGQAFTIASVMRETADVVEAHASSLACGTPEGKQRLVKELADAMAALASMQAAVLADLEGVPA